MPQDAQTIARLKALRALIDAGDIDLAKAAAARLEANRSEDAVLSKILFLIDEGRMSDAAVKINDAIYNVTGVTSLTDPEILLLEQELEQVLRELAATEAEHADLLHRLARFEAAQDRALGPRIARLLELRVELKRLYALDASLAGAKAEYEQACKEHEEFTQARQDQQELAAKTEWKLSDDEQREIKGLFREASKRCHPDVVADEHREAAANLFRELHEAYERGDLLQLRSIAERARLGIFGENIMERKVSTTDAKICLRSRIRAAREALESARRVLQRLMESHACQLMYSIEDWQTFFEAQAKRIDGQIEVLAQQIAGLRHRVSSEKGGSSRSAKER